MKNWLAPSSWFSWGGTGERENEDQGASTSDEPFLPSPPPGKTTLSGCPVILVCIGFFDGLRDNKLMVDESVGEEDGQSSEEEV